jgi:hypothetical protein
MKVRELFQWTGFALLLLTYILGLAQKVYTPFLFLILVLLIDVGLIVCKEDTISQKIQRQFKWQWDLVLLILSLFITGFCFWNKEVRGEQVILFSLIYSIYGHLFWHGD